MSTLFWLHNPSVLWPPKTESLRIDAGHENVISVNTARIYQMKNGPMRTRYLSICFIIYFFNQVTPIKINDFKWDLANRAAT